MPTLIHLADEKEVKNILRNGIKIGKRQLGVFFMPITPDYFISHQWLRELRCRRVKSYVGIYFKLPDKEEVWFGKYNAAHQKATLGQAIRIFMNVEDKLGYELLIERKIEPGEILKVVALPQTVGWRYSPDSHEKEILCVCPVCVRSGDIRGRIKREKVEPPLHIPSYPVLLECLKIEKDEDKIAALLSDIGRKRRKTDPSELQFVIEENNKHSLVYLAITLPAFKHANTFNMLTKLCTHDDSEVREYSAEALIKVNRKKGLAFLMTFPEDEVIQNVIKNSFLKVSL